MTHSFSLGDIAVLNSGGPLMTVVGINYAAYPVEQQTIICTWMGDDNLPHSYTFPAPCLVASSED